MSRSQPNRLMRTAVHAMMANFPRGTPFLQLRSTSTQAASGFADSGKEVSITHAVCKRHFVQWRIERWGPAWVASRELKAIMSHLYNSARILTCSGAPNDMTYCQKKRTKVPGIADVRA